MNKIELTNDERSELELQLEERRLYGKKKLREIIITMLAGPIILLLLSIFWTGTITMVSTLALVGIGIFMAVMSGIFWYLSGGHLRKLKRDLDAGVKLTGTSSILKISRLSGKAKLKDGMTVYEPDLEHGTWKEGDVIFYRATISHEHYFETKKVEG